ncbi:MAG: right-handed parallel beta-helix repeat-containing protein [Thiolinea sp.]
MSALVKTALISGIYGYGEAVRLTLNLEGGGTYTLQPGDISNLSGVSRSGNSFAATTMINGTFDIKLPPNTKVVSIVFEAYDTELNPANWFCGSAANSGMFFVGLNACREPVPSCSTEVTTTADIDSVNNDSGSLRDAIECANSNPGPDTITFNMPTSEACYNAGTGVWTIAPTSALPVITDAGTTLDATTQTGSVCGDLWAASSGRTLKVQLDGAVASASAYTRGLEIAGDNFALRGLSVTNFLPGVGVFAQSGADSSRFTCNHIGVAADGLTAGSNSNGMDLRGSNIRLGDVGVGNGNLISGNNLDGGVGVVFNGSANAVVYNNFFGVGLDGTTAVPNRLALWNIGSANMRIGGSAAGQRNLFSGNSGSSITFRGPNTDGSTVQGNYIGTDKTGLAAVANANGINFGNLSSGILVGGSAAGEGNLLSGQTGSAIASGSDVGKDAYNNRIIGNIIGLDKNAANPLPNQSAIELYEVDNFLVQANTLAGNTRWGVMLQNGADGVTLTRNRIYNNGSLGIDLQSHNSSFATSVGVTANDAGDADDGGNNLLNFPELNQISYTGTTVNYDFDLDVPAGDYTIEFFDNPSGLDASGYGEGEVYLGSINITHAGAGSQNFTGSFTATQTPSGAGSVVTTATTATGSNDVTSEFSAPMSVIVQGRVFEDLNYGGGAGRAASAAGTAGIGGATLELYDASGAFIRNTVTAADGTYSLSVSGAGDYFVRVVNSTVNSTRAGSDGTELGIQTFRTENGSAVSGEVGGRNPAVADASFYAVGAVLNTTNFTFSGAMLDGQQLQSVARVTLTGSDRSGVDFGFNFSIIVNTNDSGQGSLRQFILNSNLLDNAGLVQAGQTAGDEASIFMIPTAQLTSGVARIAVNTALPAITDSNTVITGLTQTTHIGDTNVGTVGLSRAVGVASCSTTVSPVNRPEVEIYDAASAGSILRGLVFAAGADNGAVRGIALYGFGDGYDYLHGDIAIKANNITVQDNILAATATGADPGRTNGSLGNAVVIHDNNTNTLVQGNYIAYFLRDGVHQYDNTSGNTISGNQFRLEPSWKDFFAKDPATAAVAVENASNNLIEGNYVTGGGYEAFELKINSTGNTWQCNTAENVDVGPYRGNGFLLVDGHSGSLIQHNVVTGVGAAVVASSRNGAGTNNIFSENSFYANDDLGIDLSATNKKDGITLNDANDSDTGPNAFLNFPIIDSISLNAAGTSLILQGCAPAGATVEVFEADVSSGGAATPGANRFGLSQDYGEGQTYLFNFVEGSGADSNGAACSLAVDADGNNFSGLQAFNVTLPLPASLAEGDTLTATATVSGVGTSEFSPVYVYGTGCSLVVTTTEDTDNTDNNTGSLRDAIECANSNPGPDTITFNMPTTEAGYTAGTGVWTLRPDSELPFIEDADTTIDATTQTGTDCTPASRRIVVELDGSNAGPLSKAGLEVQAERTVIRGLAVNSFSGVGVYFDIYGTRVSNGSSLSCSNVGTDAAGLVAKPNTSWGVRVKSSSDVVIGGSNASDRNIISGNHRSGVFAENGDRLRVENNYVGLDATGNAALGNGTGTLWSRDGVVLWPDGAGDGTNDALIRNNVISGNNNFGLLFEDSSGNTVTGNIIGLNASGTAALPNGDDGIQVKKSGNLIIGGATAAERNVIAGNNNRGIGLNNAGSIDNLVIQGNYFGVGADGQTPLPNVTAALGLFNATNITLGGGNAGEGNVIYSREYGVVSYGVDNGLIQGNTIGATVDQSTVLDFAVAAIEIRNGSDNWTIGGSNAGEGNLIVGGSGSVIGGGLLLDTTQGAVVQGNRIGVLPDGTPGRNTNNVYILNSAQDIRVGGTGAGEGNVIAHATLHGLMINSSTTPMTTVSVLGNRIFNNADHGIDLGGNGVTANDAGDGDNGPNGLLNYPELQQVLQKGGDVEVRYELDVPAGNYRIEFFDNPSGVDPTGHGEGEVFVGAQSISHSGSGVQSFTAILPGVTLSNVANLAATATLDLGSGQYGPTSEFSGIDWTVEGWVFEDLNYGGGSGRALGSPGTVGSNNVRLEIYNSAGQLVTQTNSFNQAGSDGAYELSVAGAGQYYVRAVSDSVNSTRPGSNGTELGVMTFRTDGITDVTNEVGGRNPARADAGVNDGTSVLDTSNFSFVGGTLAGQQAQAVQPVTLSGGGIEGVSFGFNFNTVVNTNASGQGSLLQFVANSHVLDSSGITQQLPATVAADYGSGDTVAVFMIPAVQLVSGKPSSMSPASCILTGPGLSSMAGCRPPISAVVW